MVESGSVGEYLPKISPFTFFLNNPDRSTDIDGNVVNDLNGNIGVIKAGQVAAYYANGKEVAVK